MIELRLEDEYHARLLISGDADGLEVRAEDPSTQVDVDLSRDQMLELYNALHSELGPAQSTSPAARIELVVKLEQ
jgi:hypothetical protein